MVVGGYLGLLGGGEKRPIFLCVGLCVCVCVCVVLWLGLGLGYIYTFGDWIGMGCGDSRGIVNMRETEKGEDVQEERGIWFMDLLGVTVSCVQRKALISQRSCSIRHDNALSIVLEEGL